MEYYVSKNLQNDRLLINKLYLCQNDLIKI